MHDPSAPRPDRWTLRDLPLAARLSVAAFLLSVGLGYLAALVNLHFSEATPGEILPTGADVITAYSGKGKASQLERLLVAHPALSFNGQGSMRRVFTGTRSSGWNKAVKKVAKEKDLDLSVPEQERKAKQAAQAELDGERLALIAWVRAGAAKQPYEDDAFARPAGLTSQPITPRFVNEENQVRIKSIFTSRCVNCHAEEAGGPAAFFPLEKFDDIVLYTSPDKATGKSLPKLALTTHTHLLSFAMLYGLTGLALALSSCPAWIRVPVAPLALVAQVIDIGFWWLARLEEPYGPMFSQGIRFCGMVVALALVLQIVLTTFSLFGRGGKLALVLLFAGAAAGGYVAKEKVIDPYILREKEMMKSVDAAPSLGE